VKFIPVDDFVDRFDIPFSPPPKANVLALRFSFAAFFIYFSVKIFMKEEQSSRSLKTSIINMIMGGLGYGLSAALFFIAMKRTSTGVANLNATICTNKKYCA